MRVIRGTDWSVLRRGRLDRRVGERLRLLLLVAVLTLVATVVAAPARAQNTSEGFTGLLAALSERDPLVVPADGADTLDSGQALYSGSRRYLLVMQPDGNLVLYNTRGRALWATGSEGTPGAHLELRSTGNLVVIAPGGAELWEAGSAAAVGASLSLGDDVLSLSGPRTTWYVYVADTVLVAPGLLRPGETLHYGMQPQLVVMQPDGNLVLYGAAGAHWATGTEGNPGAYLALQSDGNAVVYSTTGRVLWASNTFAASTRLVLHPTDYPAGPTLEVAGPGGVLWRVG